MGSLRLFVNHPPLPVPGRVGLIAGLIKGKPLMLNKALNKAGYFWGGTLGGGRLNSHDVVN